MRSIPPGEHAAAIISHYLRHLTERAGLHWTDANDADMRALGDLLNLDETADSIPPFAPPAPPQLDTRVTQELDYGDPNFGRWKAQREAEDTRRMLRR